MLLYTWYERMYFKSKPFCIVFNYCFDDCVNIDSYELLSPLISSITMYEPSLLIEISNKIVFYNNHVIKFLLYYFLLYN